MKKIDQGEEGISKNLKLAGKNITMLKIKAKANALFGMFLGGVGKFLIFTLGALILIGLARIAIGKWAAAYMPKSDGSKMTVFGVEIPGWSGMKALGIGIYNFITVGIRNWIDRLQLFYKNMKKRLVGKKGAFKDGIETRNTLRKIIGALIIANTKRAGGAIFSLILRGLGYAFCWIPGVQPVCTFLAKFGPALYAFISTQVMMMLSNKKAEAERNAANLAQDALADTRGQINKYKLTLKSSGKNVKLFQGQLTAIPSLMSAQNAKHGQGGIKREAIMRNVQTKYSYNYKKLAKASKVDEDKVKEETKERLKRKSGGNTDLLARLNKSIVDMSNE